MERLTNKKEADAQRKEYEIRLAAGYPRNIPEERFLKLAAYEDTGLEPEHVAELAQAEKDGRLVVLPCKVGDTVYRVFCVEGRKPVIAESEIKTVGQAADLAGRIGKRARFVSVFLTREEAKAALKKREEADNEAD